jgi:hypothetical protein
VNPQSRGVIATPKKAAILEAVRVTEALTNGYKSISVLGRPRQWIDQKELVLSNPLEGGIDRVCTSETKAFSFTHRTTVFADGTVQKNSA